MTNNQESCELEIQLVNTKPFLEKTRRGPLIDIDVNNLILKTNGLAKRVNGEGGALDKIINNCLNKRFLTVKPTDQIRQRIAKLQRNGWTKAGRIENRTSSRINSQ